LLAIGAGMASARDTTCDFTDPVQESRFDPAADAIPCLAPQSADDLLAETAGAQPDDAADAPDGDLAEPVEAPPPPSDFKTPKPHWSHLPLFGTQVEAKGYRIPLPLGISGTFFNANQPVNVRDLRLGVGTGPPQSADFAKVDKPIDSWQQNASARLDVWLLPFLNVYGLVGYTRGRTKGNLFVTLPALGINEVLPLLAEFNGPTYGGGATLAGGYRLSEWHDLHIFGVGDVNHTVTRLSFKNESLIAHTKPHATVVSLRLGLRGQVTESISAGLWAGTMFQKIQPTVAGSVAGRELEFEIDQRAAAPWNALIGTQLEYGKHLNLTVEGGVGQRTSILTALTFRF
jgi:hypothetical protein